MYNLIFVKTLVGFSGILSPVRIPGTGKKWATTRILVLSMVRSEFRFSCLFNLISVFNLTYILIYLGLVDCSSALVYLDGIDHRILGSLGTIDGTPEQ